MTTPSRPFAVVTGASSGIGYELAAQFAQNGFDLLIFERAGMEDTKLGAKQKDAPADVARQGFEALMAGKDHVVAGSFKNKVQATLAHVLPDTVTAGMHRKESEPGSANR